MTGEGCSGLDVMNSLRRYADESALREYLMRPRVRSAMARVASVRFLRGLSVLDKPVDFLKAIASKDAGLTQVTLRDSSVTIVLPATAASLELLYEVFTEGSYVSPHAVGADSDGHGLRVLDVGANTGVFAGYVLRRWPKCSITCVEPDPANLEALRLFRDSNPGARIALVEAAAATFDGEVRFQSGLGAGSMISEQGDPVRAVDFFSLASEADFIKMDIERGEWPILEDSRMRGLGRVEWVMEYHRRFAGDTGAAEAACELLEHAGFTVDHVQRNYWGHGLLHAHK